jgi:hypothetical protein
MPQDKRIIFAFVLIVVLIIIVGVILLIRSANIVDPMIGKTLIHYTTHGCMATIHEFDYIGTITEVVWKDDWVGKYKRQHKFYKVEVLKDKAGNEKRDGTLSHQHIEIASWYCKGLSNNLFIAYD